MGFNLSNNRLSDLTIHVNARALIPGRKSLWICLLGGSAYQFINITTGGLCGINVWYTNQPISYRKFVICLIDGNGRILVEPYSNIASVRVIASFRRNTSLGLWSVYGEIWGRGCVVYLRKNLRPLIHYQIFIYSYVYNYICVRYKYRSSTRRSIEQTPISTNFC